MAILKEVEIDLEEFEIRDLVEFIESKGFSVYKTKNINDAFKYEHFMEVKDLYTIREFHDLLPKK